MKQMRSIDEVNKNMDTKNLDNELLKSYKEALKDEEFVTLIKRLKITDEVAIKYTSKLETTVKELENCKKCRSLLECKNKMEGCVCYPKVNDNRLRFDFVACKYKNKALSEELYSSNVFEEPLIIKNARMSDIDLNDKNRAHVIKWVKNFYTNYQKNSNIKGCYLHGSFGSGKSFILASLLNEKKKNEGLNFTHL